MTNLDPVNRSATPAARKLLLRIQDLGGRATFSGQHNTPRELSFYSDQAYEITGSYPAIWGQDFGFAEDGDMDGVNFRPAVIEEALAQHAAGSIVTLMWHAVPPTMDEPGTFTDHVCHGPLPDRAWTDLLTPGTAVHRRWTEQVDVVAAFLMRLKEADVPVLWRPYHEMNGDWFWWCGREGEDGYQALYRQLFDRLVREHGLDNLLWVWNANAPRGDAAAYAGFYPGHDVVDVLAADVYGNDYRQSHHDELVALGEGRPIALGEVGIMPTPEILTAQPMWAWFMTWTNFLTRDNDADAVRRLYADRRVRHRIAPSSS
ncbi:glycosyl hydrolase [Pseudactinotalea terrae]|uniref:glycosyl hydrolase n=1 Tax=Pseudactinotalea terrae TaxID=1743262 RepID=UPI0012E286F2|nr:glycosyl hydrolase [Pseudactinotalea terrae]